MKILISLCLFLFVSSVDAALPAAVNGQPLPSLAPMLRNITPAVVNISTSTRAQVRENPLMNDPFFRWFFESPRRHQRKRESQSLGSGVIVDAKRGYVLTNHHVIEEAEEIKVTLKNGRSHTAKLLGQDPETDIAVLQIPPKEIQGAKLQDVRIANSDKLEVGDFVVAIGSPFGLNQTVTSGIVSALGRSGLGIEGYENFIQTDASINPGNSGGPLVNLRGELVGINTAILAPSGGNVGIGFAIPSNMAQAIMRQIVEHGGVNRGIFGVTVQNLTPDLAQAMGLQQFTGAMINEIKPKSPAEKAGLRVGDVVSKINRREVLNATDLHTQLGLTRIGDKVTLEVYRDGQRKQLTARIADPFANFTPGKQINRILQGALFDEVLDNSSYGKNRGIIVGKVEPESNAARIGLRNDDVIFEVNRQRIISLDELGEVVNDSGRVWHLQIRRGQRLVTLSSR